MYLHLGQDVVVNSDDVIGIFDMENTSTSRFTKEFLRQANKEIKVVTVSYEMPKSYILCGRDGDLTLYISAVEPPVIQTNSFYTFNEIHLPSGSLDLYKSANNWSAYGDFMIGDL